MGASEKTELTHPLQGLLKSLLKSALPVTSGLQSFLPLNLSAIISPRLTTALVTTNIVL